MLLVMVRSSTISPKSLRLYCSGHIIDSLRHSISRWNSPSGYCSNYYFSKRKHKRHFTSSVLSPVTPIVHNLFDELPERENRTMESSFMFLRDVLRSFMMRTETETPRSVHCFALKCGLLQDLATSSKLLTFYGRTGELVSSSCLFDELKEKDVIVWNSMITALNQNGRYIAAVGLFIEMIHKGNEFDSTTLLLAASALSSLHLSRKCSMLHCLAIETGLVGDSSLCNALMNLYAKGENLSSAECVFTHMEHRDIVSWNTIMTKCLANGHPRKSLQYFKSMTGSGQEADTVTFSCVISACSSIEELTLGESLHGLVIKSGYSPEAHVSVGNSIISMYSKCGDTEAAETVFEELVCRDVISSNAILNGFAANGMFEEAFGILNQMQSVDKIQPDIATVVSITSICGDLSFSREGRAVHGYTVRMEMQSRALEVINSVIDMYGKCGLTTQAELLFKTTTHRDLVSWNSMISAFSQNGFTHKAKNLFKEVVSEYSCSKFSLSTVLAILTSCDSSDSLIFGKSVHCWLQKLGFGDNMLSANSVINMYIGCRDLTSAFLRLETMSETRDLTSWNSVISGCASSGHHLESLRAFQAMSREGKIRHDLITLLGTISASGNLGLVLQGRCFHGLAIKSLRELDTQLQNTLITMYGRCKDIESAVKVFGLISDPNLCSWNCVISALSQNKAGREVFQLFRNLKLEPNEITFVGLLSASTQLGSTSYGMQAHCHLIRRGFQANPFVSAALVDMYSSCGMLETGMKVFRNSGVNSISAWNSVISAHGFHGMGEKAMELFKELSSNSEMEPNKSSFISLLSACSHSGFIDEGLSYYKQMEEKFGVKPVTEHRVWIVDMLGRAGKLREAYEFITGIGEPQKAGVWGALLSACNYHGDTKLGKEVAEVLFEMEPDNASYYISLANTYVGLGGWEEAVRLRKMVEDNALKKLPGYSVIDVRCLDTVS
ncbi:Tetratricopeptide repeat (TPR)-like superfamily protein [Arabidopsis thaliana]|uniref:Pentatricopeptide repeat-containing protein At4g19220, mitochondrial n=1 Tax=Arabidopsis thaliana TaxID=3702 RepID=PP324_ARATH|nr:Tetratricopeptide repeat (TPR)-like superfamily protein [Arabidopsis thaliana]O49680.2 RecName: Full=Pentatricopeptide repeat-containing protein At4g19220, mitochondrial; Flags: Precursor [Arabidopsis thaliana]AEE84161.2 Tetratricopeptide repeat (TPR)-like superfamily protein [Arabidopsis thaliana]|eukprot:NP_001319994.1 Tetratricopeptide repeat (TPR)-like superfamily protein [Arabidopsis thaliana]